MQNEILKTIQELKPNEETDVDFQGVTFNVQNKNNGLYITPETSIKFSLCYFGIVLLICYIIIVILSDDSRFRGIGTGIGLVFMFFGVVKRFLGFSVKFQIYKLITKKTTEEFKNKYRNFQFMETNS